VPVAYLPPATDLQDDFVRTLGKALLAGAQELLEIEPDEIAFMSHRDGTDGWSIALYETSPGGSGYLSELAGQLGAWARASHGRLFGHGCDRACYRCLKSYRNQFDHAKLDKELVRGLLFALSGVGTAATTQGGHAGDGMRGTRDWLAANLEAVATTGTPIERALETAIRVDGRIPMPAAQYEVRNADGSLLTVPDFAYPERKIAIYCDGFAFHGNVATLDEDARKRNRLQGMGRMVLTFWGRQILRDPLRCVDEVRTALEQRATGMATDSDKSA